MTDPRRLVPIALAFIAFVSLGLPDGLLGVAWPSMRAGFHQPLDALGMLLVAITSGYMLSSFFSGAIGRHLGIGRLLAFSCAATGLSLLGLTLVPSWWMVISIGMGIGLGAGAIDAGLNTYVATHHSERLMQWLHASFGIGVTLGPLIMTAGLNITDGWRAGYWVVGAAQLALGVGFLLTARLWEAPPAAPNAVPAEPSLTDDAGHVTATHPEAITAQPHQTHLRASLASLPVWIGTGLFFVYSGLELTLGLWAYSLLTESRGIGAASAGLWVGIYWGMFTLGRVMAGVFANRLGHHRLVLASLWLALASSLLLAWNPVDGRGLIVIGLIGFAFAPIFPGMVSGTRQRVGPEHLGNAMGMQIAAAGVGATSLPTLAGILADHSSLEAIPWFVTGCVLVMGGLYRATRRPAIRLAV
ncbi:MFS transporter [Halomonas maura]|uniref:MFS transporter n=1 Tax=Halomonas maura TaxID=117606 RepID=UPI0025B48119|nr:MFS transporter [Halomonas maura]MDN3556224.1 MFS transporter [Halomonas maura]